MRLTLLSEEQAVLAPQEKSSMEKIESIIFKIEVAINREENKATATVPAELRLTPAVVNYLAEALNKRGLTLTHLNVAAEHQQELANLPNVVLKKGSDT